jgi:predicted permease
LSDLASLFVNNLLPILLIAGTGYLLGRFLKVDPRPISQINFYILLPALIFDQLTKSELNGLDFARMASFTLVIFSVMALITYLIGRLLKLERTLLVAVILSVVFMNSGNYGLPLILFAFHETGMAYASIYFITIAVLINTAGILIASMGRSSLKAALAGLYKLPAIYALLLAVVFNSAGWTLPDPLQKSVSLLSAMAIPAMLILLGLQLHGADGKDEKLALGTAGVLRMLVAPAIAVGLAALYGLQGPARQAAITESAMPSGVFAIVLASEYNTRPGFVTTVVLVTTLLSPLTLTPLLAYLLR